MELELRYTASSGTPSAVVLHGSSPEDWLRELNRWNCSLWHLECYVLPRSLRNPEASGLLVLPGNNMFLPAEGSFSLYQKAAAKLLIPVEASLYPSCTQEELDKLLIWDLHLFHPSIGFIGFDKTERMYLSELLETIVPADENWSCADFGIPARDRLLRIQVEPLSREDMMDALKDIIDPKSLDEILPKENKDKAGSSTLDKVKEGIFKSFISASEKIRNSLPESTDGKDGVLSEMLGKFGNWMNRNLDDLEKRRNAELEKLLNMFDKNMDEALKYAIPLDSNFLNRGQTNTPSDKLGKHSTSFNLGGIGGSGADYWNVDKYYNDLRAKYLKAAQEEIRKGNFEKAAYIYAHLLHDFHSAANVLMQGRYFREAAILYKEQLKDAPAAANCLETGGLYEEAIRIYLELNQYEKVADLYTILSRKEKADEYYEKAVLVCITNSDYLEASRIYRVKLVNQEREEEILLNGWAISHQSEACLKTYFNRVQETRPEEITTVVKTIYRDCSEVKYPEFLQVLHQLRSHYSEEKFDSASREIAYEILSDALKKGNKSNIQMFKTFVEGDKLIVSDGLRFKAEQREKRDSPQKDIEIQLDNTIRWSSAIIHGNQFLALGVKSNHLRMARGNWSGNLEYYSWPVEITGSETFTLMKDNFFGNRIILNSSLEQPFEERVLPKNKYFNQELKVQGPGWKQQELVAVQNRHMGCSLLKTNGVSLTLHSFDSKYNLIKSEPIVTGEIPVSYPMSGPSQVVEGTNCSYAFLNTTLMAFNEYRMTDPASFYNFSGLIVAMKGMRTVSGTILVVVLENETWLLHAQEKTFGVPQKIGNFRAVDILFLSTEKIVLADKYEARLYSFKDSELPTLYKYDSKLPLAALLTTTERNKFAMLDITGRMEVVSF